MIYLGCRTNVSGEDNVWYSPPFLAMMPTISRLYDIVVSRSNPPLARSRELMVDRRSGDFEIPNADDDDASC
jgi:hypothetical protein